MPAPSSALLKNTVQRVRPFLKWPGGKFRVLDRILPRLPRGGRLVEPFTGSGAVWLNAGFEDALLNDANSDLITLYALVQEGGAGFVDFCRSFFVPENNTPDRFLELRARYNASRDRAERAALFVYLNRHAYNGLVRYNAKGLYNVPFGRYASPPFPEKAMLDFARAARLRSVRFVAGDFRDVFTRLEPGDVVYCDPPYVPLSETAHFTSYARGDFGPEDQRDLAALAHEARDRGIPVLVSNHDTPVTRVLYRDADIVSFDVRRTISCKGDGRGRAAELLALFLP